MPQPVEMYWRPTDWRSTRTLCAYLGSFDPPHRGHEWLIAQLLARFETVLVLVPGRHFEKTIRFPFNAALEQRLAMLRLIAARPGNQRLAGGLAREVLFIRLAAHLRREFPQAEISFGMGSDTFERLLDSPRYYARSGLAWTAGDQRALERLQHNVLVFGRSANGGQTLAVPEAVRRISSTRVRATVKRLRSEQASEADWQAALRPLTAPDVLRYIRAAGLYADCEDCEECMA